MASEEIKVMTPEGKELTLVFQEGCFDSLIEAGVPLEEIEQLKQETIKAFQSGQAFEDAQPISDEDAEMLEEVLAKRATRQ